MKQLSFSDFLRSVNLRDTCGRRTVLAIMSDASVPVSIVNILDRLGKHKINLTTVNRILAAFEHAGIVHRLLDDRFLLCSLPGDPGHHALLRCAACDRIEEIRAPKLCKAENAVARSAGFRPLSHRSELVGTCTSCHPSSSSGLRRDGPRRSHRTKQGHHTAD